MVDAVVSSFLVKRLVIRLSVRICVRRQTLDGRGFDRRPGNIRVVCCCHRLVHLGIREDFVHRDRARAGQDIVTVIIRIRSREVGFVDIFSAHLNATYGFRLSVTLIGFADRIVRYIQTAIHGHLAVHVQPCAANFRKIESRRVVRKFCSADWVSLRRIALLMFSNTGTSGIIVVQAVEEQVCPRNDGAPAALLHAQGRTGQEFEAAVHGHIARRA